MAKLRLKRDENGRPIRPDVDPEVTVVRRAMMQSGMSVEEIYNNCFLSKATIFKFFAGNGKRPQHMSVVSIMQAMGYRRTWTK